MQIALPCIVWGHLGMGLRWLWRGLDGRGHWAVTLVFHALNGVFDALGV